MQAVNFSENADNQDNSQELLLAALAAARDEASTYGESKRAGIHRVITADILGLYIKEHGMVAFNHLNRELLRELADPAGEKDVYERLGSFHEGKEFIRTVEIYRKTQDRRNFLAMAAAGLGLVISGEFLLDNCNKDPQLPDANKAGANWCVRVMQLLAVVAIAVTGIDNESASSRKQHMKDAVEAYQPLVELVARELQKSQPQQGNSR